VNETASKEPTTVSAVGTAEQHKSRDERVIKNGTLQSKGKGVTSRNML
jgi:hypothetical protein